MPTGDMGRRLFRFTLAVGAALTCASTSAQAASNPNNVCCFRVTVDISGFGQNSFTPSSGKDSSGVPYDSYQGNYLAFWDGTFYQIFRLYYGELKPVGQGVGGGSLDETDDVVGADGSHHERCAGPDNFHPVFAQHFSAFHGDRLIWLRDNLQLVPRDHHLEAPSPFSDWGLGCRLDYPFDAWRAAYGVRNLQCSWFSCDRVAGLSVASLRRHQSTSTMCKFRGEYTRPPEYNLSGQTEGYSSAYYVNIVPFPESQLKAQRQRLRSRHGKEIPQQNPAARASRDPHAPNGCN